MAGQGGEENQEGELTSDFRTQVRFALQNVRLALESRNSDLDDVVKLTTLVVDHSGQRLEILSDEFKKTWPKSIFPTNTMIPVPGLALDGMWVEIEAVAVAAGR